MKNEKQVKKLVKYLKGTGQSLIVLAEEIEEIGTLDKESEELMSKIGSNLLFYAKTYTFLTPLS